MKHRGSSRTGSSAYGLSTSIPSSLCVAKMSLLAWACRHRSHTRGRNTHWLDIWAFLGFEFCTQGSLLNTWTFLAKVGLGLPVPGSRTRSTMKVHGPPFGPPHSRSIRNTTCTASHERVLVLRMQPRHEPCALERSEDCMPSFETQHERTVFRSGICDWTNGQLVLAAR